jgi:hypothetical protein
MQDDAYEIQNTSNPKRGNGCVAQLNRASDYGSEGFRFES